MNNSSQRGYTLIEILVATAVLGVLLTIASAIFINTIRSNNKAAITTEAKENSSLVTDTLDRDVHLATNAVLSTNTLTNDTLTLTTGGGTIVWRCMPEATGVNGYITRNGKTLTNRDPFNGVSWTGNNCVFNVTGDSTSYLVSFNFTLTEGSAVHAASQDITVHEATQFSVATRGY